MKILGLTASGVNPAACVIVDNKILAFAEEERFCRVKLASGRIPVKAAKYCLDTAGLKVDDLDHVTVGWNYNKYPEKMRSFFLGNMDYKDKDEYSHLYEEISLRQNNPVYFEKLLKIALVREGLLRSPMAFKSPTYVEHHYAHACSVYYASPFDEAYIIVIDGSGEELATTIWFGQDKHILKMHDFYLPNSIGYFYAAITEYLGFSVFMGEGKVMGLAPYGKSNDQIREVMDRFVLQTIDGYSADPSYVYFGERSHSMRFTDKLAVDLGIPPRLPKENITEFHKSVAYEAQRKLEDVVCGLARSCVVNGTNNICLAGGVAMNCKMNGALSDMKEVEDCFVIPASTDAGTALGSALSVSPFRYEFNVYSGPEYNDKAIVHAINEAKIRGHRFNNDIDLCHEVAKMISDGKIVGWFQGRMEVGARALGNRSILADPRDPKMKDKLNAEVKHRESFRPFAPSVLPGYLNSKEPWMLKACFVDNKIKKAIPAVIHEDGSVRPQVVTKENNEKYYNLITEFNRLTGVPAILNTSFNVRGEPIVCTPQDALRCFYSTGIDVLILGNWVIQK